VESEGRNPPWAPSEGVQAGESSGGDGLPLGGRIGDHLDVLIEYLMAHEVKGIHPLIMGQVERRLVIKALERSRGNKARAAKVLGIGRNTFLRKVRSLNPTENAQADFEEDS
jgi:DNA-binding protein Fis